MINCRKINNSLVNHPLTGIPWSMAGQIKVTSPPPSIRREIKMEIDKTTTTKLEKRAKTRANFSWHRGWLRPVSPSRRARRLVRGGGNESAAFGQSSTPLFCTPVVNQHPSTRRPPPRQALSGNAQTGLEIESTTLSCPATYPSKDSLRLFSYFPYFCNSAGESFCFVFLLNFSNLWRYNKRSCWIFKCVW